MYLMLARAADPTFGNEAAAGRRHMTRAVSITRHILGFHDLTCIELNRMMAPSKAFSVPAKTNRNLSSG
jgi:hypothetical protein